VRRGALRLQLALDRVEDDAGGEQLGEKERLGFAGLPEHIKRNSAALIRSFDLSRSSWPWVRDEDQRCALVNDDLFPAVTTI
jgi:hypothetical protein